MTTSPSSPLPATESGHSLLNRLNRGDLRGARELRLSAGLTRVPDAIFDLADSLEVLDLSNNELNALPPRMAELRKLKILFCSNNPFEHLPDVLGLCPNLQMIGFKANRIRSLGPTSLPAALRWLILTDNQIEHLPSSLGECQHLQKLMLAGNQLRTLPSSMANCTHLELIRLSANRLETIPSWLLDLPKLAWLALASNPAVQSSDNSASAPLPQCPWTELQLGPLLGEGASGRIYAAQWRGQQVAVKVYKGAMTSDGLPQAELQGWRQAGKHPGLVPVLAQVIDHPHEQQAVLMPRLPAGLQTLANPPSFATCTRDVYPHRLNLSLPKTGAIAAQVISALTHLHQQGVMHGDLYGHNLQVGPDAKVVLGDFGAATCYQPVAAPMRTALQRIELRAFGHLLTELIEQSATIAPEAWISWAQACVTGVDAPNAAFDQLSKLFAPTSTATAI